MPLPLVSTIVSYPQGALASSGTVLYVEPLDDGRTAVVLDRTAFHAVDTAWPDQGADRGTLAGLEVVDAIVGASDGSALYIGGDIPVRKGTEGWAFVVVHLIVGTVEEGASVEVLVDADYRERLSTGHTACHLASLALNSALADSWTKDVATDAAGSPNFDALAIESSTIVPNGSRDVYRVGKSLRKKGFDPAALDDVPLIEAAANERLAELIGSAASIRIETDGPGLDDRRYWVCGAVPGQKEYRIPCGGTHRESVSDLTGTRITLERAEVNGAIELVMTTTAN